MAQRYVEWHSVHTNGVALRQMAQRNVEWYSVHRNVLSEILKAARTEQDYPIIVGGDFNVILHPALVDGAETTEGKTPQN